MFETISLLLIGDQGGGGGLKWLFILTGQNAPNGTSWMVHDSISYYGHYTRVYNI